MSKITHTHNNATTTIRLTRKWFIVALFLLCCHNLMAQERTVSTPTVVTDTIIHEMCQGDTLRVRDSMFTTAGIHTLHIEYGEDSIYNCLIHITVHPSFDTSFTAGICDGQPYTAFGFNETVPGNYVKSYATVFGCDSIYRAHLVGACSFDTTLWAHACSNVGYTWDDSTYFESTTIVDSSQTLLGCDSVTTIHLTVDTAYLLYDTVKVCQGETYEYRGIVYTPQCVITDSLLTQQGCDSIIHISLEYYDSLFHADPEVSLDGEHWYSNDTIFEGCEMMRVYLRHRSEGSSSVHWTFGDGEESSMDSLTHDYPLGLYTLTFIAESPDGCSDTVVFPDAIHVFSNPMANYGWSPVTPPTEDKPEFQFLNLSNPQEENSSYLWTFYNDSIGNEVADTSTLCHPQFSWDHRKPSAAGYYQVQLVAYYANEGLRGDKIICTDTAKRNVFITRTFLQFPNMVTPNGDGTNDVWRIVNLVEYNAYITNTLTIFDRTGHVVYERHNISYERDFWDPNQRNCPDGTYFFRFTGSGPYGSVERKGTIDVIR